LSWVTSAVAIE